jgi:hypothetical protein
MCQPADWMCEDPISSDRASIVRDYGASARVTGLVRPGAGQLRQEPQLTKLGRRVCEFSAPGQ